MERYTKYEAQENSIFNGGSEETPSIVPDNIDDSPRNMQRYMIDARQSAFETDESCKSVIDDIKEENDTYDMLQFKKSP
jgi:hypothetical protein